MAASARDDSQVRLHVGGLSTRAREYDLLTAFSKYGKVKDVNIAFFKSGPRRGLPQGFAFVTMGSREEAREAQLGMDGAQLHDKNVTVRFEAKEMVFSKSGTISGHGQTGSRAREFRTADEKASDARSAWQTMRAREREQKLAGLARLSDKVAMIEAKLLEMDQEDARREPLDLGAGPVLAASTTPSYSSSSSSSAMASGAAAT